MEGTTHTFRLVPRHFKSHWTGFFRSTPTSEASAEHGYSRTDPTVRGYVVVCATATAPYSNTLADALPQPRDRRTSQITAVYGGARPSRRWRKVSCCGVETFAAATSGGSDFVVGRALRRTLERAVRCLSSCGNLGVVQVRRRPACRLNPTTPFPASSGIVRKHTHPPSPPDFPEQNSATARAISFPAAHTSRSPSPSPLHHHTRLHTLPSCPPSLGRKQKCLWTRRCPCTGHTLIFLTNSAFPHLQTNRLLSFHRPIFLHSPQAPHRNP